MITLKWSRLKDMKCPSDKGLLKKDKDLPIYRCTTCTFKISEENFNKTVANIYRPSQFKTDMEKLADWNNMGHKKVTEGFEDSPHLKK